MEISMPLSTKCIVVVNVKKALEIRENGGVISDSSTLFKCIECGKTVRPYTKTKDSKSYFSHLKRNPNCSLSDKRNQE
jgi:hypothetical protein